MSSGENTINAVQTTQQPTQSIQQPTQNPIFQEPQKTGFKLKPKYIIYAIVVLILLYLIYQAYCKFAENQECEDKKPKRKKGEPEEAQDEPPKENKNIVPGFNLRKEISELNNIQKKLLSQLQITE